MKALNLWIDCPDCDYGYSPEPDHGHTVYCPSCNGKGQVYDPKVAEAVWALVQDEYGKKAMFILDAIVAVADTVELEWDRRHGLDPLQHEQRLVGPWEEE